MIETIYSNPELYHSGVKGQKWGQRRYQNLDGTWTEEGKRRRRIESDYDYEDDEDDDYEPRRQSKKKISAGKVAAIGAGLIGAGIVARKAYDFYEQYKEHPWQTLDAINRGGYDVIAKARKKVSGFFKRRAEGLSDAAFDAAMVSIGGIAVSKLTSKLKENDSMTDGEKAVNKILLDTGTASINHITNSGKKGNTATKDRRPPTKEEGKRISELLGPPKQKDMDRNSERYQALFKNSNGDYRNQDDRAKIKSLASAGYGIDQLEEYVKLGCPSF